MADRLLSDSTTFNAALKKIYPPNVYNANPLLIPRGRLALSTARQGDARMKLAICGDSTSAGAYAGTGTSSSGPKGATRRGPSRFAAKLAAMGLPVNLTGTSLGSFAANTSTATAPAFDPLLTSVTGFSGFGFGFANPWFANAAGSLVWSLPNCTNIDIYVTSTTNSGVFTYSIDGGAATTYTYTGTAGNPVIPITGLTLGTHTVTITWVSGIVSVMGVNSYNIAVPQIDVFNGGFTGSKTADWATSSAFEKGPFLKTLNPDLTLIYLGTNDLNTSVATATSMANLTTLAGYARFGGGDIILIAPHVISGPTTAAQVAYQQGVIALGTTLNCPVFDLYGRGAVQMTDTLHPTAAGYDDLWTWIGSQFLGMI